MQVYWFRNDLRLADNRALTEAAAQAATLLPVYIHDPAQEAATRWVATRMGTHRQRWLAASLAALRAQLEARGSGLLELHGTPAACLAQLGADTVWCETIAAPFEQADLDAIHACGIAVRSRWQSTLLEPGSDAAALPMVFTQFRLGVERAALPPVPPLAAPLRLPPLPCAPAPAPAPPVQEGDARSAFPYWREDFAAGEQGARAHLARYFGSELAHSYKATRNGLQGTAYSTKFSPWLASGAMSARQALAGLRDFEARAGASDGSYWIWFELLWRDYFRLLHLCHGKRLYRAGGLHGLPAPPHDRQAFARWCEGRTGEPLIDAGMRELSATGFLSNRLRQVVASYLVHELACDWRAGAAWFEHHLLDYDVYSNQGNWLYLAGRGTDPRGMRRFDPAQQAARYDPDGAYRQLWCG